MNLLNERPLVSGLVLGLVAGILIGWFALGWGIAPVTWTDASPSLLYEDYRSDYVVMAAKLYQQNRDAVKAQQRMATFEDPAAYSCQLATGAPGGPDRQALLELAQVLSPGVDCNAYVAVTTAPAEEEGSLIGRLALLCGVGLLAAAVVGAVFFFISRRGVRPPAEEEMPEGQPAGSLSGAGGRTIPLAQFPTEYNIGHDTYDDSFSIETATGEFLGECGVGISEGIGIGDPKKVTAFEVWLFDKNDIRTVTKVIMSEHAYYDEALRAKLAPKGEAVLARPNETVVLETASLIINGRIIELEYGAGELPPNSFFDRMVVEMAAWAKEPAEVPAAEPAELGPEPGTEEFSL
jgi:hypothetical protein